VSRAPIVETSDAIAQYNRSVFEIARQVVRNVSPIFFPTTIQSSKLSIQWFKIRLFGRIKTLAYDNLNQSFEKFIIVVRAESDIDTFPKSVLISKS
jgi:hypothetical protein